MNCQNIDDMLYDYFFGGLELEDVRAVETHLRNGCVSCQETLDSIAMTSSAMVGELAPVNPPPDLKIELLKQIQRTPQRTGFKESDKFDRFLKGQPRLLESDRSDSTSVRASQVSLKRDDANIPESSVLKIVCLTIACCLLAGYLGYRTSQFPLSSVEVAKRLNSPQKLNFPGDLDPQNVTEGLVATTSMQFVSVKQSDLQKHISQVNSSHFESPSSASDPQVLTGYVAYDSLARQLHVGFRLNRDSLPIKRIRCTAIDSFSKQFELGELSAGSNDFLTGAFDLTEAHLPIIKLLLSDWDKPIMSGNEDVFLVVIDIRPNEEDADDNHGVMNK